MYVISRFLVAKSIVYQRFFSFVSIICPDNKKFCRNGRYIDLCRAESESHVSKCLTR